ncbi:MAG: triose-phosphate isomerase [Actinomycetes bacterium]
MPDASTPNLDKPSKPSPRVPLMSGNWKMNLNHFEATVFVDRFRYLVSKESQAGVEVSIHPPFTDLRTVQTFIESEQVDVSLGAQNVHWDDSGAMTGEISPAFLAKLNVRYVIVGHSERRELFGETDEWVHRKVLAVLKHAMTPILCVGETAAEREEGSTESKVGGQVTAGLVDLTAEQVGALVIAYEPIWAIGTGQTATSGDAQAVCALIRSMVKDQFGADAAASVRIQYGGSVKASNVAELMAEPDIDGALVGGASLDPEEFAKVVQFRSRGE